MYHAERWHRDFPAVTVSIRRYQVFVRDFVSFNSPLVGEALGKVIKLFKKVMIKKSLLANFSVFCINRRMISQFLCSCRCYCLSNSCLDFIQKSCV